MRDLLNKLTKLDEAGGFYKAIEGPNRNDEYRIDFQWSGDDGEEAYGDLYFKVVDGKVDPRSLRGETDEDDPRFGDHKVDSDFATDMVKVGGEDHEDALDIAQQEYDEMNADKDESIEDDSDEQTFEGEEFYEYYGYLPWHEDVPVDEAEYRGRKVPLNKPMRGDVKKFKVYVKDPKTGNVKKVNFGHGGSSARKAGQKTMKIRKSNPKARKSFRARHNCANPGPKTKARYWSCRKW